MLWLPSGLLHFLLEEHTMHIIAIYFRSLPHCAMCTVKLWRFSQSICAHQGQSHDRFSHYSGSPPWEKKKNYKICSLLPLSYTTLVPSQRYRRPTFKCQFSQELLRLFSLAKNVRFSAVRFHGSGDRIVWEIYTVSQFDKWGIIMKMAFSENYLISALAGQLRLQRTLFRTPLLWVSNCLQLLAGFLWFSSKRYQTLPWTMVAHPSWTERCCLSCHHLGCISQPLRRKRENEQAMAERPHCHSSWTQGNNRPCISTLSWK